MKENVLKAGCCNHAYCTLRVLENFEKKGPIAGKINTITDGQLTLHFEWEFLLGRRYRTKRNFCRCKYYSEDTVGTVLEASTLYWLSWFLVFGGFARMRCCTSAFSATSH